MKTESKNIKLITKDQKLQLFYLIGVFLFCIKFFIEKLDGINFFDNIIAIAFCTLFGIKMIFQKYNKKQLIIVLICGILSAVTAYITKEYVILYTFLMIFASQNIELKKIIKVPLYTFTILLLLCTIVYAIMYFAGVKIPLNYRVDGSVRLTFFMTHPNIYAGLILWCSAMFMYIKGKKLNKIHYLILILINIVVFVLTDSRTSFMAFCFFIITFILSNKQFIKENNWKIVAKYSFVTLMLLTIAIAFIYSFSHNNSFMNKLNEASSQRVYLSSYALQKYGTSILPRNIDFTEKVPWITGRMEELFIDSIYVRAFIKYGILYLISLIFISLKMVNKKSEKSEVPFILLFSVVGVFEKYITYSVVGFPLLFFGKYLWGLKNEKE